MAVGYNDFDMQALNAHGVLGTNTPDVLNESTADFGWALMMVAARSIAESEHFLHAGKWGTWSYDAFLVYRHVYGATLGVLGMGCIGQELVRRALGFNMRVIYHNHSRVAPEIEAELASMQLTATLINIAGGGIVDDAALIQALRKKTIAAAGLDVFEGEPNFNPDFLTVPNVVLTPHIASATESTCRAMANLAADNLIAALCEGPRAGNPPNPINPEVLKI